MLLSLMDMTTILANVSIDFIFTHFQEMVKVSHWINVKLDVWVGARWDVADIRTKTGIRPLQNQSFNFLVIWLS